jgi:hypothetical protein
MSMIDFMLELAMLFWSYNISAKWLADLGFMAASQ